MNTSNRGGDEFAAVVGGPTASRAGGARSLAIVAALALLFAVFLAAHFRNMPSGDDFIAILKPALAAHDQGWQAVNLREVFAQHFSHRIAPVRVMVLAQVLLFGKLDFVAFMWVGLVSWLAIFILLAWQAGFTRSSAAMVFLALVWFQPQASANCLVAMQAASNLPVILLALAAFAFRAGGGRVRWFIAWVAGLLAGVTTGNGFVVLLVLLLWDGCEQQWKRLFAGALITACSVVLYFMDFANPESQKYASSVSDTIGNLLVMTGAIANLGRMPLWAVYVAGGVLGLVAAIVLYSVVRRGEFFLAATLLFVGGSIVMASLARAGWGNAYMLQPRYLVYPILLLAICGAYFASNLRAGASKIAIVLLGFLFAAFSWWHHAPGVVTTARSAQAGALSWNLGSPGFSFSGDQNDNLQQVALATELLRHASERGVFTPQDTGMVDVELRAHGKSFAVAAQWNNAAAAYIVQMPAEPVSSALVLFEADGWQRVGFKPASRLALGRLLRGQPQSQGPYIVAAPPVRTPDPWHGEVKAFGLSSRK